PAFRSRSRRSVHVTRRRNRACRFTSMNPTESHTLTPYAASLERVPYSGIRELGEAAMAMDGVLRLYFGESNVPTPQFIVDAAVRALADGYTFYSENAGLPSLRS